MNKENAQRLYNELSKTYDLGSFEEFCADIEDDNKRKKLFDATAEEYNYGDFGKFNSQLGFNATIEEQPVPQPAATVQPTVETPKVTVPSANLSAAQHSTTQQTTTQQTTVKPAAKPVAPWQDKNAPVPQGDDLYTFLPEAQTPQAKRARAIEVEKIKLEEYKKLAAQMPQLLEEREALKAKAEAAKKDSEEKDKEAERIIGKKLIDLRGNNLELYLKGEEAERYKWLNQTIYNYQKDAILANKRDRENKALAKAKEMEAKHENANGIASANYATARHMYEDAATIYAAPSKYGDENPWANWGHGIVDTLFDRDIFSSYQAGVAGYINDIVGDANEGKELRDDQIELLIAYLAKLDAQEARSFDLSTGYQIGQGTAESLKFMADMMLTRGLGTKGAQAICRGLMSKAPKAAETLAKIFSSGKGLKINGQIVGKAATTGEKVWTYAAGEAIGTPLQTISMPTTWTGILDDQTQYMLESGDTGWSGKVFMSSFGDALKETTTERFGGDLIDWSFGKVFPINRIFNGIWGRNTATEFIHNPGTETAEEYLGAIADFARSYDPLDLRNDEDNAELRQSAEQMFTWEGLGQTAGTVAPISLLGGMGNSAALIHSSRKLNSTRKALRKMLQESGATAEQAEQMISALEQAKDAKELMELANRIERSNYVDPKYKSKNLGEKKRKNSDKGVMENYLEALIGWGVQAQEVYDGIQHLSEEEMQALRDQAKAVSEKARENYRQRVRQDVGDKFDDAYGQYEDEEGNITTAQRGGKDVAVMNISGNTATIVEDGKEIQVPVSSLQNITTRPYDEMRGEMVDAGVAEICIRNQVEVGSIYSTDSHRIEVKEIDKDGVTIEITPKGEENEGEHTTAQEKKVELKLPFTHFAAMIGIIPKTNMVQNEDGAWNETTDDSATEEEQSQEQPTAEDETTDEEAPTVEPEADTENAPAEEQAPTEEQTTEEQPAEEEQTPTTEQPAIEEGETPTEDTPIMPAQEKELKEDVKTAVVTLNFNGQQMTTTVTSDHGFYVSPDGTVDLETTETEYPPVFIKYRGKNISLRDFAFETRNKITLGDAITEERYKAEQKKAQAEAEAQAAAAAKAQADAEAAAAAAAAANGETQAPEQPAVPEQPQAPKYPTKKDGTLDWDKMTPQQQYDATNEEAGEEEAQAVVEDNIRREQAAIENIESQLASGKGTNNIAAMRQGLRNHKNTLAEWEALRKQQPEQPAAPEVTPPAETPAPAIPAEPAAPAEPNVAPPAEPKVTPSEKPNVTPPAEPATQTTPPTEPNAAPTAPSDGTPATPDKPAEPATPPVAPAVPQGGKGTGKKTSKKSSKNLVGSENSGNFASGNNDTNGGGESITPPSDGVIGGNSGQDGQRVQVNITQNAGEDGKANRLGALNEKDRSEYKAALEKLRQENLTDEERAEAEATLQKIEERRQKQMEQMVNAALEGIDGVSGVTVKGGIGVYLNSQGQEVIEYTYSVEANVTEASEQAFTAAMAMVAEVSKQDSFIVNYLDETKENTKGNHGSAAQVRVKLDRPLTPTEKAQLTNMFSQLKLGVTITEDEITSSNFDKEHISDEDFTILATYLLRGFNYGNAETCLQNARRVAKDGNIASLDSAQESVVGDGGRRVWSGTIESRTNYSDYNEARNNGKDEAEKRYLDADGRETDTERYYGEYYTSADEANKGRVPQTNLTPDELRSRVQAAYDSTEEAMSSPAIDTSNTEVPNAPKPDAPKPIRKPRKTKPKLTDEEKEEQAQQAKREFIDDIITELTKQEVDADGNVTYPGDITADQVEMVREFLDNIIENMRRLAVAKSVEGIDPKKDGNWKEYDEDLGQWVRVFEKKSTGYASINTYLDILSDYLEWRNKMATTRHRGLDVNYDAAEEEAKLAAFDQLRAEFADEVERRKKNGIKLKKSKNKKQYTPFELAALADGKNERNFTQERSKDEDEEGDGEYHNETAERIIAQEEKKQAAAKKRKEENDKKKQEKQTERDRIADEFLKKYGSIANYLKNTYIPDFKIDGKPVSLYDYLSKNKDGRTKMSQQYGAQHLSFDRGIAEETGLAELIDGMLEDANKVIYSKKYKVKNKEGKEELKTISAKKTSATTLEKILQAEQITNGMSKLGLDIDNDTNNDVDVEEETETNEEKDTDEEESQEDIDENTEKAATEETEKAAKKGKKKGKKDAIAEEIKSLQAEAQRQADLEEKVDYDMASQEEEAELAKLKANEAERNARLAELNAKQIAEIDAAIESSNTGYDDTLDSDDVYFRTRRVHLSKEENKRREPMRKRAKELEQKLGVPVRIIEDLSQLPDPRTRQAIRRAERKGSTALGWFDASTGEVFLYMPGLADVADVEQTYIHEAVAHRGLRALLGEAAFNNLCDEVWSWMNANMSVSERQEWEDYPGVRNADGTINTRVAADEYMAHVAEQMRLGKLERKAEAKLSDTEHKVWNKIVEYVKRALRKIKLFFNPEHTGTQRTQREMDDYIRDLIVDSYANMRSGNTAVVQGEGVRMSAEAQEEVDGISRLAGVNNNSSWSDALSAIAATSHAISDTGTPGQSTNSKDAAKVQQISEIDNTLTETARQEMQTIRDEAIANGTYMKAPNGKPTHLNERQWLQVRTQAFKEWFGDWENDPKHASKIVDENGEPRVVYHGTSWDAMGEPNGRAVFGLSETQSQGSYLKDKQAFFFALKNVAENYGNKEPLGFFINSRTPNVYDVQSQIDDVLWEYDGDASLAEEDGYPLTRWQGNGNEAFEANDSATAWFDDHAEDIYEESVDNGADAIVVDGTDGSKTIIAFSPNQIKSATDNNGDFSESDNDIRFSVRPRLSAKGKKDVPLRKRKNIPQYAGGRVVGMETLPSDLRTNAARLWNDIFLYHGAEISDALARTNDNKVTFATEHGGVMFYYEVDNDFNVDIVTAKRLKNRQERDKFCEKYGIDADTGEVRTAMQGDGTSARGERNLGSDNGTSRTGVNGTDRVHGGLESEQQADGRLLESDLAEQDTSNGSTSDKSAAARVESVDGLRMRVRSAKKSSKSLKSYLVRAGKAFEDYMWYVYEQTVNMNHTLGEFYKQVNKLRKANGEKELGVNLDLAHLASNMRGRAAGLANDFSRRYCKPLAEEFEALIKQVSLKRGVPEAKAKRMIDAYLLAYGYENRVLTGKYSDKEAIAKHEEHFRQAWNGLSQKEFIEEFESDFDTDKFWEKWDATTKAVRELEADTKAMTEERKAEQDKVKHYVPQRNAASIFNEQQVEEFAQNLSTVTGEEVDFDTAEALLSLYIDAQRASQEKAANILGSAEVVEQELKEYKEVIGRMSLEGFIKLVDENLPAGTINYSEERGYRVSINGSGIDEGLRRAGEGRASMAEKPMEALEWIIRSTINRAAQREVTNAFLEIARTPEGARVMRSMGITVTPQYELRDASNGNIPTDEQIEDYLDEKYAIETNFVFEKSALDERLKKGEIEKEAYEKLLSHLVEKTNEAIEALPIKENFLNAENGKTVYNFSSNEANYILRAPENFIKALRNRHNYVEQIPLFSTYSRWLSRMQTEYNPMFAPKNFVRDTTVVAMNALAEDLGLGMEVIQNIPQNWATIAKFLAAGKIDESTPEGKRFADFIAHGGRGGFSFSWLSKQAVENDLTKKLLGNNIEGTWKQIWNFSCKSFSFASQLTETAVRFATYSAALKKGYSEAAALKLSQEINVNYNNRGFRDEGIGKTADMAYQVFRFVNPAVQASRRFFKYNLLGESVLGTESKSSRAGRIIRNQIGIMSLIAFGYGATAAINSIREAIVSGLVGGGDGDDDETEEEMIERIAASVYGQDDLRNELIMKVLNYDKYTSMRNATIGMNGKLPLDPQHATLFYIGSLAYNVGKGRISLEHATANAAEQMALNFLPIADPTSNFMQSWLDAKKQQERAEDGDRNRPSFITDQYGDALSTGISRVLWGKDEERDDEGRLVYGDEKKNHIDISPSAIKTIGSSNVPILWSVGNAIAMAVQEEDGSMDFAYRGFYNDDNERKVFERNARQSAYGMYDMARSLKGDYRDADANGTNEDKEYLLNIYDQLDVADIDNVIGVYRTFESLDPMDIAIEKGMTMNEYRQEVGESEYKRLYQEWVKHYFEQVLPLVEATRSAYEYDPDYKEDKWW